MNSFILRATSEIVRGGRQSIQHHPAMVSNSSNRRDRFEHPVINANTRPHKFIDEEHHGCSIERQDTRHHQTCHQAAYLPAGKVAAVVRLRIAPALDRLLCERKICSHTSWPLQGSYGCALRRAQSLAHNTIFQAEVACVEPKGLVNGSHLIKFSLRAAAGALAVGNSATLDNRTVYMAGVEGFQYFSLRRQPSDMFTVMDALSFIAILMFCPPFLEEPRPWA